MKTAPFVPPRRPVDTGFPASAAGRPRTSLPVHIVMFSPSYGGAEKRFFDVFRGLLADGVNVKYVGPSSLTGQFIEEFASDTELLEAIVSIDSGPGWHRAKFINGFRRFLRTVPRRSAFHYPLTCLWPLHLHRGDRISLSFVDCTSTPALFSPKKTSSWAWLSFFIAKRIDILSPTVFRALSSHPKSRAMTLTPGGTFCLPGSNSAHSRQPIACFIGRLVPGKGLEDFFRILTDLWARLKDQVPHDFSFVVAGYGPLTEFVKERVAQCRAMGVPVEYVGFVKAEELLSKATVFLSLQEVTNYPSRVVAEALVNGCAVVVRDTGDSRSFGDDIEGLEYCAAELRPEELATLIGNFVREYATEPQLPEVISKSAALRFGGSSYLDYFKSLLTGPG